MIAIKKWGILFSILILPYLVVVLVENATHNILTLGYLEQTTLDMDSLGQVIESIDSIQVPAFQLTNQNQEFMSNEDLIGQNYIVNFFFTSCPTICPTTTLNLIELQTKIKNYGIEDFRILSISVDPEIDTPNRLKEYAESMNIDLSNWDFLTGPQHVIYDIVESGFSLSVGQDSLVPGGVFIRLI